ncbi:DNA-directed RNA polymerase subunit omega [Mesorhizobium sp. M0340]|uniref:DNA-directed RNA polymerase subunit omega n=1 Tax=Mesorhizobium sp. M0340 TaxID=2956939 RepID=UPI00333A3C2C
MDPLIVLDCENTVPNRFALAVAAAGRARALSRGSEPRLSDKVTVPSNSPCARSPATASSPTRSSPSFWPVRFRAMAGFGPADEESFAVARAIPGCRTRLRSEGGALTMSGKEDEQWRNG